MGTLTVAPFGTYTSVEVVSANGQTEIIASIDSLKALIADPSVASDGTAPASPDFGFIPPGSAALLRAELTALAAAVEAMPTA